MLTRKQKAQIGKTSTAYMIKNCAKRVLMGDSEYITALNYDVVTEE